MSDQQAFPEDPSEYADPEHAEHHHTGKGLALPGQNLPDKVYIIPIHNRPFFPAQVLPVIVNEEPWAETLDLVAKSEHHSLALFYMDTPQEDPRHFDTSALPLYGTLVKVHHASRENGKLQFVAQGLTRVRLKTWLKHHRPPYLVEVEYPHQPTEPTDEVKAYGMALINAIKELLPLNPLYSEELKNYLNRFSPNDPSPLTDFAAALTSATGSELQEVLDCVPMLKRMEKVLPMLRKEVEVARLQRDFRRGEPQDRRTSARILPQGTTQGHPAGAGPDQGRSQRRHRTIRATAGRQGAASAGAEAHRRRDEQAVDPRNRLTGVRGHAQLP